MAKSLTKQFTGLLILVHTSEGNIVHCDRKGMAVRSVRMNSIYSLFFFSYLLFTYKQTIEFEGMRLPLNWQREEINIY